MYCATAPSLVTRVAFLAATETPFLRSRTTACSRSPLASLRACLQSIIGAPVFSRSSFTCAAEIFTVVVPIFYSSSFFYINLIYTKLTPRQTTRAGPDFLRHSLAFDRWPRENIESGGCGRTTKSQRPTTVSKRLVLYFRHFGGGLLLCSRRLLASRAAQYFFHADVFGFGRGASFRGGNIRPAFDWRFNRRQFRLLRFSDRCIDVSHLLVRQHLAAFISRVRNLRGK